MNESRGVVAVWLRYVRVPCGMCKRLPLSRGIPCIDLDYWAGLGMHIFGSMAARRYILLECIRDLFCQA